MSTSVSRRRLLVMGASQVAWLLPLGCKKNEPVACAEPAGNPDELAARKAVAYTESTPDPSKDCAKCRHFVGAADSCGTCKLLKGPIHPKGSCKVFSPT